MADDQQRVCPSCGTSAGDQAFCGTCGINIYALDRLPTRAEWRSRQPAATDTSGETDAGEDRDSPSPVEPGADALDAPDGRPGPQRFKLLRAIVLIVVVVLAAFGVAQPDAVCGPFRDTDEIAEKLVSATIVVLLLVAVITTVIYAVGRFRSSGRTWMTAMLSWPTIATAFILLLAVAAGSSSIRQNDCSTATVDRVPVAADEALTEEQRSAVSYQNQLNDCLVPLTKNRNTRGSARAAAFLRALEHHDTAQATTISRQATRVYSTVQQCAALISVLADDEPLVVAADRVRRAIDHAVDGWTAYRDGTKPLSVKLLTRGDDKVQEADRLFRSANRALSAVYNDRGGDDVLGDFIDGR